MRPRWTHVVLLVAFCALAFGGTFTCRGSSGDDDSHVKGSASSD